MTDTRIDALAGLAGMVSDHRLGKLAEAVARRDATIALRDGLTTFAADDPVSLHAQAVYDTWVDRRRVSLTAQIEAESAVVERLMSDARRAFARAQVLAKLRDQLS